LLRTALERPEWVGGGGKRGVAGRKQKGRRFLGVLTRATKTLSARGGSVEAYLRNEPTPMKSQGASEEKREQSSQKKIFFAQGVLGEKEATN